MNIKNIDNIMGLFSYALSRLGCVALFAMMSLTVVDVVGRYVFNSPILGTFEVTSFLVSIMVYSFLGYAQSKKSHVTVDILVNTFPRKAQSVVDLVNHTAGLFLMTLITWKGFEKAIESMKAGDSPMNLPIPIHPFIFFLAFGCGIMCIEFVRDIFQTSTELRKKKENSL
ncbi:MAG: TRAP transporter small permease [Pseudomonadota bacterium]